MTRSRSILTVVLAGVATLACAAGASAATTITSGMLTNELGAPTSGTVRVYAVMPHGGTSPLLGTALAGATGQFAVTADDPAQLVALTRSTNGWLDWWAVADTGGFEGLSLSTSFIDHTGGVVRSVTPEAVGPRNATAARVSSAAPSPRVRLKAGRPLPARAAQGRCKTEHEERVVARGPSLAVVGELNNAYNDGTSATFTYGRGGESATYFGIAYDDGSGNGFRIDSEKYAAYQGSTTFPTVRRRYARKMRSGFTFEKRQARNNSCAVWDTYVLTTGWQGTQNVRQKQSGTLNRCVPEAFGRQGFLAGGRFSTTTHNAVRWSRGVSVYGANLTTRSGFDQKVEISYRFRGGDGKKHYLCGPDGRTSAASSGRVFSGAVRR